MIKINNEIGDMREQMNRHKENLDLNETVGVTRKSTTLHNKP